MNEYDLDGLRRAATERRTPDLQTVLDAQDGDDAALQRMIDAGAWSLEGSMGRADLNTWLTAEQRVNGSR